MIYYKEYYQEKFTDFSFVIIEDNFILATVKCCIIDDKFSLPEGGIIIDLFQRSDKKSKKIYDQILNYVDDLSQKHNSATIVIRDFLEEGKLSPLGEKLFNNKFQSRLSFEMEIPYENFTINSFHSSVRKSYKSLINWGEKNLEIIDINQENQNFGDFKKFQDYHYKISGKKTRSDKSWDIQFEMIKEGYAELTLGFYKDNLAAGSIFADYGNTSTYFTGVYERNLFDFGISHFLLYRGICRSYERGNTSKFSLGYFDTDIKDPKWYNIQHFKKGFCKELKPTIFWSKEIINDI